MSQGVRHTRCVRLLIFSAGDAFEQRCDKVCACQLDTAGYNCLQTPDCTKHFHSWVSEMASFVKGLAPKQLLTIGAEVHIASTSTQHHAQQHALGSKGGSLGPASALHTLRWSTLIRKLVGAGLLRCRVAACGCQSGGLGNRERAGIHEEPRVARYRFCHGALSRADPHAHERTASVASGERPIRVLMPLCRYMCGLTTGEGNHAAAALLLLSGVVNCFGFSINHQCLSEADGSHTHWLLACRFSTADMQKWVTVHVLEAQQLNKPLLVEEFGKKLARSASESGAAAHAQVALLTRSACFHKQQQWHCHGDEVAWPLADVKQGLAQGRNLIYQSIFDLVTKSVDTCVIFFLQRSASAALCSCFPSEALGHFPDVSADSFVNDRWPRMQSRFFLQGPSASGLAVLASGRASVPQRALAGAIPCAVCAYLSTVNSGSMTSRDRKARPEQAHFLRSCEPPAGLSTPPGASSPRMLHCCATSVQRQHSSRAACRSTSWTAMCRSRSAPSAGVRVAWSNDVTARMYCHSDLHLVPFWAELPPAAVTSC